MNKLCECGCGEEVTSEKNRFLKGHNKGKLGKKVTPETKNRMSKSQIGKIHTKEHNLKVSVGLKGKKRKPLTSDHIKKISTGHKGQIPWNRGSIGKQKGPNKGRIFSDCIRYRMSCGHKGKIHLAETKIKMSISAINYIEKTRFKNRGMCPGIGKNEIHILDQIEKAIGLEIDRNSRKLSSVTGKFNDGFIHRYNLGIDVLEKHHFKFDGSLSDYDFNRESIIAYKLGCMIYYIPEQEFLKNPDKEIQRFKDFLLLLDEGKN